MKRMTVDVDKYRLACARRCVNSKELAEMAGIPRSTLGTVFKRQGGSPATVGKIARALGVDVLEILADDESLVSKGGPR